MDAKPSIRSELATLVFESIRFAHWAAGEGICPVEGEDADAPDEFLSRYADATGDQDWETLAERVSTATQEARDALKAETARAEAALDAALEQQRLREEAREAERAAVVEWLRLEASRRTTSNLLIFASAYNRIAERVERGDHLSQESGRG